MSSESLREFDELLEKLCEQQLDDAERARFEEMLRRGEPWRQRYLSYVDLHATLWVLGGDPNALGAREGNGSPKTAAKLPPVGASANAEAAGACELNESAEAQETARRARLFAFLGDLADHSAMLFRPPLVFFTLLAAVLFSGFAVYRFSSQERQTAESRESIGGSIAEPAAYLTVDNGIVWGGGRPVFRNVGSAVQLGDEIAITEGVAEFRLASGVAVAVEGPAVLMLASPSSLVLQYGKLTAHVPWGVDDFKVLSAGCRIVSRNAEFGVCLMSNQLDIHSFNGEVTAASSIASPNEENDSAEDDLVAGAEGFFAEATVAAGRALRLAAHGEVLKLVGWGKAKPASFVAKLSMSGPLPVSQTYVDLIKSAKPVGYWRFEKISNLKVANEIESATALMVVSANPSSDERATSVAERRKSLFAKSKSALVGSKENRSLELRPDSEWFLRGRSKLPISGPEYSMEVWVKPSHLHLGQVVGLHCHDGHYSSARLELQGGIGDSYQQKHAGELRYVHRAYKGKPRDFGVSCFPKRPYSVRRWQHIVAVKTATEMKLYVDGKLVSSASENVPLSEEVSIKLGAFSYGKESRKFIGQIDELAVYNRALSEEEIHMHYQLLKQAMENSPASEGSEPAEDEPGGV